MDLTTIIIDAIQNGYMVTYWTKGNQEKVYMKTWLDVITFVSKNIKEVK